MSVIDRIINHGLFENNEELLALTANKVTTFGDLEKAARKEPRLIKPVLDRYIAWFNKNIAPKALREMGF